MAQATCSFYDVPCHASWLVYQLELLVDYIYDSFMSGAAAIIDIIPVPDFLLTIEPIVLSSQISFFLSPFQIEYGLGIIVSAYTARFIVRRLPIIG